MKRILLISLLFAGSITGVFAKDVPAYAAHLIPAEVRKGAHAVVRSEVMETRLLGIDRYSVTTQVVVTILDKEGEDLASVDVPYDQLSKVQYVKGWLYDAQGKELKKLKRGDIQDGSYYSSVNFMADNRYKAAELTHHSFPYTVVWEYAQESENTLFYPGWTPNGREKLGVENSRFEVIFPPALKPRYRQQLLPEPELLLTEEGYQKFSWSVSQLPPVEVEPQAVAEEIIPYVQLAPTRFRVEDYEGNMESWQYLGDFMHALNKGRADLDPEEEEAFFKAVSSATTNKEKVAAAYHYMQSQTRYVSIQLGIGGWQPFPASFVKEKGYGDCKALTNYMQNLLQLIDIPSYYTVIRAGEDEVNYFPEDFVMSTFNHVILCVPNEGDTLWLECTSQTAPFNYLGKFTANRKALLISPEGGKVVNTPHYPAEENREITQYVIDLRNPNVPVVAKREYQGLLYDNLHDVMRASRQQQESWVRDNAGLAALSERSFSMEGNTTTKPTGKLEVKGFLMKKPVKSGKRLFVPLSQGEIPVAVPTPVKKRKTAFEQAFGETHTQTVSYNVPEGSTAEYLPEPVQLNTPFGSFYTEIGLEDNTLTCSYTLSIKEGQFAAGEYANWVNFMQEVKQSLQAKAVVIVP